MRPWLERVVRRNHKDRLGRRRGRDRRGVPGGRGHRRDRHPPVDRRDRPEVDDDGLSVMETVACLRAP